MFVNETMLILAYTANMMATLPEKVGSQAIDTNIEKQNVTTTTLSPEEKENQFDLQDQWYMWRCFEPYGCFYIGAPWSGENRPVSTFPARPDSINPRYVLYTRGHTEPQELKIDKYETIQQSPFRKKANLYLIIHGFLDNGDKTWVMRTMKELLLREDCNVVVVNWIGGAGPPYTQAVANTRLVGAMTARLAYQLIEVGRIDPAKMHCIGHSLGAHTCGYVGYTLRQRYDYKLGRITGLDPAEPHFSNTSTMVRLDPTDATFVTAIHTDCNPFISGGLGITQPVAHIDFYPNGGRNQPGCNEGVLNSITLERGSFFRGIKRFLGCNHIRSYEYFIESINTNCPFLAVPCSSWDKFEEGSCFDCVNQYCPRFGLDAQPGNYHASVYLLTGSSKPFCKGHYKVTINISKTDESVNHGGEVGTFVIRIFGEKDKKSERIHLSPHSKYYEPGSTHTVVLAGDVVGKPEAIEISWEYQASVFNPLTWRLLHTPRVYIDSLTIYSLESSHGITVCPDATKTLIANEPKILTMKNCRNAESNLVSA
ncbi:pancreatic triacylglycerol lipase [Megachile rotundata]|uniref:pancreatic triacylglycerol lipase n=1 Tax=Megachile rotundata TaxID=143995 RepID=UPI000258DBB4|nr:PREDICTED: pancreatic triacylglycerol lipase-like isoform X1 [Megachile rotundata]XP_012137156.1 PREDICTED: pancreatic triacylglycerol lipase-like isoform X1 [Megachile rotundata]